MVPGWLVTLLGDVCISSLFKLDTLTFECVNYSNYKCNMIQCDQNIRPLKRGFNGLRCNLADKLADGIIYI